MTAHASLQVTDDRANPAGTELLTDLAATPPGDPHRDRLRERTIEAWLPLAHRLAQRYAGHGEPLDDLVQVAVVGLIKSVDRFDPERGIEFPSFAIPTVTGEIKRHFRDRTWSVRVPRRLQELRLAITAATTELTQSLQRSPTVAEIAERVNASEEEVLEGLEGARAYSSASLSAPMNEDGSTTLADTLGGHDAGFELAELRVALGPAMATLDQREQRLLAMRFYGNLTQTQIAAELGISQMHVSRLLARALTRLRKHLE